MNRAKISKTRLQVTERKPNPRERRPGFLTDIGKRLKVALDARQPQWGYRDLAEHLGRLWEQDLAPYTRVKDWLEGEGGFSALTLHDIAKALSVSADWLLYGEGPMHRDQLRSSADLRDDLAAEVRRRVHQYARDIFEGLDASHIEVNAESLLSDFIDYTTAEFTKGAVKALEDAARYGAFDGQVHVISALVDRLPYALRSEAYEAASVLRVNALANTLGRDAEASGIHLNESGINALLPSQQFDGTDEAVLKLIAIAEEPRRMP